LGFEERRSVSKEIKISMIHLAKEPVPDIFLVPGKGFGIVKITNSTMTARNCYWSCFHTICHLGATLLYTHGEWFTSPKVLPSGTRLRWEKLNRRIAFCNALWQNIFRSHVTCEVRGQFQPSSPTCFRPTPLMSTPWENEASESRLWARIHFCSDINAGRSTGSSKDGRTTIGLDNLGKPFNGSAATFSSGSISACAAVSQRPWKPAPGQTAYGYFKQLGLVYV
jgi:hypothetical protein